MTKKSISLTIWTSTILVYVLPFLAWGSELDWDADDITLLKLFPLLGLWALAQMWLHYAIGAIKRRNPDDYDYKPWYRTTSSVVFVLILLHPAIVVFKSVSSGLTPIDYVGPDGVKYLALAYFALTCFLLYEAAERFQSSQFLQKNFDKIKVANIFAMIAIFTHSFGLGGTIEETWLRYVWILMFVVFIGLIFDSYTYKSKSK